MGHKTADFEFLVDIYRHLADKYHNQKAKQVRKYSGLPYTVHTDEVELLVREVEPDNIVARAAAHGHDIYEDVLKHLDPESFTIKMEGEAFLGAFRHRLSSGALTGDPKDYVDGIVQTVELINNTIIELSNVFTTENFPQFNREKRKQLERERLAEISPSAQTVKLADILSNSKDIYSDDPEFAKTYLREKAKLVPLLHKGNPILLERATLFLKPWSA